MKRASGGRSGAGKMPRYAERHRTSMIDCELGEIVDLSRSGMRVKRASKPPVKVGQLVKLDLKGPAARIGIVAKVVWLKRRGLKSYQLGLMFLNVRPSVADDIDALAQFGYVPKGRHRNKETLAPVTASFDTTAYYELLGLEPGATEDELQDAYRSLALKYHPDVNPDGQEHFLKIKEAYEILRRPSERKAG